LNLSFNYIRSITRFLITLDLMPKRKETHKVYRDDDLDDANDVDIPQSRTLRISQNGRTVVETPPSPQKRPRFSATTPGDEWEPSLNFEGRNELDDIDDGENHVEGGGEVNIADKAAARRYPTSVRDFP
jgi:hypothetical protein